MLRRLLTHVVDIVMPESQSGFRRGRGTTDMIFVSRLLQDKRREQHQSLFLAFIDLTKAFDSQQRPLVESPKQIWLPTTFPPNAACLSP